MKTNMINLVANLILAFLFAMLSMDWWSVMLASLLVGFIIPLKGYKVFLMPCIAIFLFWSVYAFVLGSGNEFRLAKQIGVLFSIGDSPYPVIFITGLIGGLAAGIAGILGKQLAVLRGKK